MDLKSVTFPVKFVFYKDYTGSFVDFVLFLSSEHFKTFVLLESFMLPIVHVICIGLILSDHYTLVSNLDKNKL